MFAKWNYSLMYPTYRDVKEYVSACDAESTYTRARDLILETGKPDTVLPFMTEFREFGLLAEFIERVTDHALEQVGYHTLKETAKAIEAHAPLAAAKLYRAEALEILSRAKAKAYHYALENLQRVKDLYEANGRAEAWSLLAIELRALHKRKSSFIGAFQRIVSGQGLRREPSFMERIGKHLPDDFEEID